MTMTLKAEAMRADLHIERNHPITTWFKIGGGADLFCRPRDAAHLAAVLRAQSQALWRERSFYRLLNRMLFHAAAPEARYRVFERFYTLPEPLIRRFYAGRTTLADKARILSGRPPVPLVRAVAAMFHHPEPVHA